jgi:hypothetical protein
VPAPSIVTSRFPSDPLTAEPGFTLSPAEWQVHSSIPCPQASVLVSDSEFVDSCQFRLGASGFVPDAPAATCFCGAQLQGNDATHTHTLTCNRMPSSYQHYQRNIVTEALRNATSWAGLSSTREPLYRDLDQASTVGFFFWRDTRQGKVSSVRVPGEKPYKRLESRHGPLKSAMRWRENRRLALLFVGIFT